MHTVRLVNREDSPRHAPSTAAGRTGKDRVAKKQLDREGEVHYLLIGKLDDTVLADEKKIMELYCLQE